MRHEIKQKQGLRDLGGGEDNKKKRQVRVNGKMGGLGTKERMGGWEGGGDTGACADRKLTKRRFSFFEIQRRN